MRELKISDVRLRGREKTLDVASQEANVPVQLMDTILWEIYVKAGAINLERGLSKEEREKIQREIVMPKEFNIDVFETNHLEQCLKEDLLVKDRNTVKLTEKSINILKKAARRQRILDEKDFCAFPPKEFEI